VTRAEWTGVVLKLENMLFQCKTLGLNPSPTKKKKKKGEIVREIEEKEKIFS
jgi:hypothetical protein